MSDENDPALENVLNFRDIGKTVNSKLTEKAVREGLIYRSATLDNASTQDVAYLSKELGIKTVIDLRTSNELALRVAERRKQRLANQSLPESAQIPGIQYHEINMTGWRLQMFIGFRLPVVQFLKSIYLNLFGYHQETMRIVAENVMVKDGLLGMGCATLDHSGGAIAEVLTQYTSNQTTPVLVHCTRGKDRTGLICILILMILNIDTDTIMYDYQLTDEAFESQRAQFVKEVTSVGLTEEWAATDKGMVAGLEKHLENKYGGLDNYLDSIGFDVSKRELLRKTLLHEINPK